MEAELSCPICLDLFTKPIQLACKHHVCWKCVQELVAFAPKHKKEIICPLCRGTQNQTPTESEIDIKLQSIVDTFKSQQGHCSFCEQEKTLTNTCLECSASFCADCKHKHPNFGVFKLHTISAFSGKISIKTCSAHPPERLSFYCTQCNLMVCTHCLLVDSHVSHPRISLVQAVQSKKENLSKRCEEVTVRGKNLQAAILTIEKTIGDLEKTFTSRSQKVAEDTKSLVELLLSRRDAMQETLAQTCKERREKLEMQLGSFRQILQSIESTSKMSARLLEIQDPFQFFPNYSSLEKRLISTLEFKDKTQPIASSDCPFYLDISKTKAIIEAEHKFVASLSRTLLSLETWNPDTKMEWTWKGLAFSSQPYYRSTIKLTPTYSSFPRQCANGDVWQCCITPFSTNSKHFAIPYRMKSSSFSSHSLSYNTLDVLLDFNVGTFVLTNSAANQFIEAEFKIPTVVSTIVLGSYGAFWQSQKAELQYEIDDGKQNWRTLINLGEKQQQQLPSTASTLIACSIDPISARRWRVFVPSGQAALTTLLFFSAAIPEIKYEESKSFNSPLSPDGYYLPVAEFLDAKTLLLRPLSQIVDNFNIELTSEHFPGQDWILLMSSTYGGQSSEDKNSYKALTNTDWQNTGALTNNDINAFIEANFLHAVTVTGITLSNCTIFNFSGYVNSNLQFQYYDEKTQLWVTLFKTDNATNKIDTERTFPISNITARRWRLFNPHGFVSTGYLKFIR